MMIWLAHHAIAISLLTALAFVNIDHIASFIPQHWIDALIVKTAVTNYVPINLHAFSVHLTNILTLTHSNVLINVMMLLRYWSMMNRWATGQCVEALNTMWIQIAVVLWSWEQESIHTKVWDMCLWSCWTITHTVTGTSLST